MSVIKCWITVSQVKHKFLINVQDLSPFKVRTLKDN